MRLAVLAIVTVAWSSAATVDSIGMMVSDLDRSIEFYTTVLHFQKTGSQDQLTGNAYEHLEGVFGLNMRIARLRLGDESIELTEFLVPKGRPIPLDTHANDRSFQHLAIIVSDMNKAYAWLRQNKVQFASTEPQRLPDSIRNAAGIQAFYFRDPDGHFLEILQFPPDKGKAKWHTPGDQLFLGIDHTAIVVADTEASLRFYRDILGMRVVAESENFGSEQEHLNNVFGARLRITSLAADGGPGVEFLQYLAPRDGRVYPLDEQPNDLIHWQTRFSGVAVNSAVGELQKAHYQFVSCCVTSIPGFRSAIIVRDPDGHAVQIAGQ